MKKLFICIVIFASSMLLWAEGNQDTDSGNEKAYELTFAYSGGEGAEDDTSAKEFKKMLEERTDGRINVTLYGNEQLGKEIDVVSSLEMGTVNLAIIGPSFHQQAAPEYNIWSAYYLFNNTEEVVAVVESELGDLVRDATLKNKDIIWAGIGMRGPRNLTSNKPIRTPADVKGLNIRIPLQPIYVKSWETLGAKPQAIAYSELYTALRQGVVEAQENPLAYIYTPSFYEVQKYVNLTQHQRSFFNYCLSNKFYTTLPEDLKVILIETIKDTSDFHNELQASNEVIWRGKLENEGMEFIEVDIEAFQEALSNVPKDFEKNWAPGFYDEFLNIIGKLR